MARAVLLEGRPFEQSWATPYGDKVLSIGFEVRRCFRVRQENGGTAAFGAGSSLTSALA
jgi:hypothetical protein